MDASLHSKDCNAYGPSSRPKNERSHDSDPVKTVDFEGTEVFYRGPARTGTAQMAKFANVVTVEVCPGRRDQLLPLLMAHKARCLKDEPGTLQFEILLPHDDDTKVLTYEVYRDDAAFEVHRNGSSFARLREETAGMVDKIYGTRCVIAG
jgi:quinol monooxygenase YgiN